MRRSVRALAVVILLFCATVGVAAPADATPPATGVRWTITDRLGRTAGGTAVSCSTVSDCWAVESGMLEETTDLGVTWTDRSALLPRTAVALGDVACPVARRCLVTATTGAADEIVVVGGGSSTSYPIPVETPSGLRIDCLDASTCVATDGTHVARTADGGVTWTVVDLPSEVALPAVSCAHGTRTCMIVGSGPPAIFRTPTAGASWIAVRVPSAYRGPGVSFEDVDCVSATVCRIAGTTGPGSDRGFVLTTENAGRGFVAAALPAGVRDLRSLDCAGTACRAVGYDASPGLAGVRTTDGVRWTSDPVDRTRSVLPVDVACPAGLRCVAVAPGLGFGVAAAGRPWATGILPAAFGYALDASCVDAGPCVLVGADTLSRPVTLRGAPGRGWTQTTVPGNVPLVSVDCAGPLTCVALERRFGRDIGVAWRTTDGGATWRSSTLPVSAGYTVESGVTCPSELTCLVYREDADHLAPDLHRTDDGGATWTAVPNPVRTRRLDGIDCPSVDLCVIAGATADGPVLWRSTDLAATTTVVFTDPRRFEGVHEVRCVGDTCLAEASYRRADTVLRSTDRGRSWVDAGPPTLAGEFHLAGLHCSTHGRCVVTAVASDGSGRPRVSTDTGATWRADTVPKGTYGAACSDTRCFALSTDARSRPVVVAEPS